MRPGGVVRVSGVTIDITERKEAEERQALLAREVDHRARNALAVVQSIVRLTKRGHDREPMSRRSRAASGRCRARTRCCRSRAGRAPISSGWSTRSSRPTAPTRRQASSTAGPQVSLRAGHRADRWRWPCTSSRPTRPSTARCRRSSGRVRVDLGDRSRADWCCTGRKPAGRRATRRPRRASAPGSSRQRRGPARRPGARSTGGPRGCVARCRSRAATKFGPAERGRAPSKAPTTGRSTASAIALRRRRQPRACWSRTRRWSPW